MKKYIILGAAIISIANASSDLVLSENSHFRPCNSMEERRANLRSAIEHHLRWIRRLENANEGRVNYLPTRRLSRHTHWISQLNLQKELEDEKDGKDDKEFLKDHNVSILLPLHYDALCNGLDTLYDLMLVGYEVS